MIHNVWHSTSVQPFYLCCHTGWFDMSNCGWNCQLAVGHNQPISHPLAVILGHLVGYDVAGRRASGSRHSIPFFSPDKRRIARQFQDLSRASNVRFGSKADIGPRPDQVRSTPKGAHRSASSWCPLSAISRRHRHSASLAVRCWRFTNQKRCAKSYPDFGENWATLSQIIWR
jgi:hypothetical protein